MYVLDQSGCALEGSNHTPTTVQSAGAGSEGLGSKRFGIEHRQRGSTGQGVEGQGVKGKGDRSRHDTDTDTDTDGVTDTDADADAAMLRLLELFFRVLSSHRFSSLGLHASTALIIFRSSRSLLRQVSQVGSCWHFFGHFFLSFFNMDFC